MLRSDRQSRHLALSLAAVAGFVDSVGFLMLGGFFVSFMSGNTTRLAVGMSTHAQDWQVAGLLILSFLCGVMGASAIGRIMSARHRAVLAVVALLLGSAALLGTLGQNFVSAMALAAAMGAENSVFEQDGEVRIGLTYMTGTLVKLAQRIVGALMGEEGHAWRPHALLWLSLTTGAILGAVAYVRIGPHALWFPLAGVLACLPRAARIDRAVLGERSGTTT